MGKKGKGRGMGAVGKVDEEQEKGGKMQEVVKVNDQSKTELGDKNLDEFLNDWDNEESDGDDEGGDSEDSDGEEEDGEESDEDEEESNEDEVEPKNSKSKTGAKDQKNYISRLKEKDPEFFKFLKENDQELLNFDESSDDDEDESEKKESGKHKLPDKLEVASDESDFEDNEEEEGREEKQSEGSSKKLNQSQVEVWSNALTTKPTPSLVTEVMAAFRGAVATVGAGGEEAEEAKWKVEGGAMFNSVVRLAVVGLVPALRKVFKIEQEGEGAVKLEKPEKSKQWRRVERPLRGYMLDLVALLGRVGEPSVLGVLLKHTHSMLPFYQVGLD